MLAWWLTSEAERKAGWRPGGVQQLAVNGAKSRLYAIMHRGGIETHKDPGKDVWVFDVSTRQRVQQIALKSLASSIQLSNDAQPLLYSILIDDPNLDIYDAAAGKLLRSVAHVGTSPTLMVTPRMRLPMKWLDAFSENSARALARGTSRRSVLAGLGSLLLGATSIPLLPVARGAEVPPAGGAPKGAPERGSGRPFVVRILAALRHRRLSMRLLRRIAVDCARPVPICRPLPGSEPATIPATARTTSFPTTTAAARVPAADVSATATKAIRRCFNRANPTTTIGAPATPKPIFPIIVRRRASWVPPSSCACAFSLRIAIMALCCGRFQCGRSLSAGRQLPIAMHGLPSGRRLGSTGASPLDAPVTGAAVGDAGGARLSSFGFPAWRNRRSPVRTLPRCSIGC